MTYFVIVYNRQTGEVKVSQFAEAQRHEARSLRFLLENDLTERPEYEVVVLGGGSLEQIKRTHGRYFKNVSERAAS
jgi:hypothetical protein